MGLTKNQEAILHFVKERCEQSQPPTYRDIQQHFGYGSVNAVQGHVKALIKKGVIERPPIEKGKRARGLVPTGYRQKRFRRIPIYGEIAAGSPVETTQTELGAIMVAETIAKGPAFALKVKGDSMINAGIFEGDYVVVESRSEIKNGDIVVALITGENTLKRYVKKEGKIWLIPENTKLKPIAVTGELQIQGKVVGLQRQYR